MMLYSKASKKIQQDKGITLVALIITVVILVILSAVTIINMQQSKMIEHAVKGTEGYTKAQAGEADEMDKLGNKVEGALENITKGETTPEIPSRENYDEVMILNNERITGNSATISVSIEESENEIPKNIVYNYYIVEKGNNIDNAESIYSGTENSYVYRKLKSGTEYDVKVTLKDEAGIEGKVKSTIKTLNYGTTIQQSYGTIYYGTTNGISSDNLVPGYSWTGNTYIVRKLTGYRTDVQIDVQSVIDPILINQPQNTKAGTNIVNINEGKVEDTWIGFHMGQSSGYFSSLLLIFENGEELNAEQAIEKGYVAPLVMCESVSGATPMTNPLNLLSRWKYRNRIMGTDVCNTKN